MTSVTPRPAVARGNRWLRCGAVGAWLLCTWMATTAIAADRIAPMTAGSADVEDQAVRYRQPPTGSIVRDGVRATPDTANPVGDLWHVAAALALVVAIIFGLRWVARRTSLVPTAGRPGRGVRLLSRTVLSPRQQVLLLQVGRRVVVVGDAGAAGMRPLCEITDPDEVTALVGEARAAESNAAAARSFGGLFRRAAEPFADDDSTPVLAPAGRPAAEMPPDVVGLLDKVRGLRQQFDR